MTPLQQQTFARAANALRSAEAMAGVAGVVGAAADTPPADESKLGEWFADWTRRARETLGRTYQSVVNAPEQAASAVKERASKIGSALREAADALKSISPFHAIPNGITAIGDAAKGLEGLTRAAFPPLLLLALIWLFGRSNK